MTSPADELRTAAEELRALATAASTDPDGTPTTRWHTKLDEFQGVNQVIYRRGLLFGDYLTRDDGRTISWPHLVRGGSPQRPPYLHTQHAEYAATMGPNVGLALADWLDVMALCANDEGAAFLDEALAVARAITGGQQ